MRHTLLSGRLPRWALAVTLCLYTLEPLSAQSPVAPNARLARLEQWLAALVEHRPGTVDEPLTAFGKWAVSDWQLLADDAHALIMLSRDPGLDRFWVPRASTNRSVLIQYAKPDLGYLRELSCVVNGGSAAKDCSAPPAAHSEALRELRRRVARAVERGDHNYVLHAAALLHTDLAQWGGTRDAVASRTGGQLGGVYLNVTDGLGGNLRQYGMQRVIAYWLLDRVVVPGVRDDGPAPFSRPLPGSSTSGTDVREIRDPWVRDWYVAVAWWMQRTGHYDESHINRGLLYFPGDSDLRFLSGCQHEIDASPEVQSAVKSVNVPYGAFTVQSHKTEMRAAELDFAQALSGRPGWAEARIRRGHALLELGELSEADTELRAGLATANENRMRYYALLFLGAIQERSGRFPEARALYQRAGALFPTAQSPALALSQLLRRQGRRQEAVATLHALFERDRTQGDVEARVDPWWEYLTIQARDADSRLDALLEPFLRERRR